jgi:HK97 family phage major capsid protein
MKNEEILDAVDDLGKVIEKKTAAIDDHTTEIKELKAQLLELKARGGRQRSSAAPVSFKDAVMGSILEQKAKILALAADPRGNNSFDFEVKAVADMTFPVNFSSANASTATIMPGIIAAPPRPMHIRALLPGGNMTGSHFVFVKEVSHDGDPAAVAEAGNKPQMDFNLTENSSPAQTIAAWLQISNQMLYDVDSLTTFLSNRLLERLYCIEDNQLLSGNGTSPNLLGINSAGNFTAATGAATIDVELLVQAIAQLAGLSRRPSGIILNPADYFALLISKASTSGLYNLPAVVNQTADGGGITIAGVPVVWTAEQAVGTYTVGDFMNGAQLLFRNSPRIEFFVDATLAKVNKTLIRIEERVAFSVFGSDYIIKGTLAT